MQLSTKGRYAVMAMVDLAMAATADSPNHMIPLADIACRQQLSQAYLEQLFGKLRRAELVCATRGPGEGYRLARPSSAIAIADIVAAVDEPIRVTRCETGSGGCMLALPPAKGEEAKVRETCQTHDLWFELGRQIALFLGCIALADVVMGHVTGRAVSMPPSAACQEADQERRSE